MERKFMITGQSGEVICSNIINATVAANTWLFYIDQYKDDVFELKQMTVPVANETPQEEVPVLRDDEVEVMDEA